MDEFLTGAISVGECALTIPELPIQLGDFLSELFYLWMVNLRRITA